jgi:hypothetical protein
MRRTRGVFALLRSVLLGLAVIAAAQPGNVRAPAPLVVKRWASVAPSGAVRAPAPLVVKRWA